MKRDPLNENDERIQEKTMKRLISLMILIAMLLGCVQAAWAENGNETEELLKSFVLTNGDRNSKKIAITVDDCYKNRRENIIRDVELCREYNVHMTFFPIVYTGCMSEEYREIWQSVLDAGCEIGSHSWSHWSLGNRDNWGIIKVLGQWQEALDQTLGYHYETRWFRPPYGSIEDKLGNDNKRIVKSIQIYGYDHVVRWDVSETNADKALKKVQNGSIMLYHAIDKDTRCLEKLIPALLEQGYELVTLSELFGFEPPQTSDELYVYKKELYQGK